MNQQRHGTRIGARPQPQPAVSTGRNPVPCPTNGGAQARPASNEPLSTSGGRLRLSLILAQRRIRIG